MSDFVVDKGLVVLVKQVDTMAPGRNKDSDGTIGDDDHALRESAHNPETPPPSGNPDNQVDAADITHDPAHGADMGVITERIRLSRDRRVQLVIFNRRIFSSYAVNGVPAWTWRPYYGDNPHDKHAHVQVNDLHHDETQLWSIGMNPSDEKALIHRVNALIDMALENPYGDGLKPEPNKLAQAIIAIASTGNDIEEALGRVATAVASILPKLTAMQEEMAAMKTRLDSLEQGPQPAYAGTATMTLHVDTTAQEIDRGGQ
jgi:hypothetical protein